MSSDGEQIRATIIKNADISYRLSAAALTVLTLIVIYCSIMIYF